ncbi:uncharacterized protein isoform X2 [Musca autumnalis]|uniref:uncharacterized protein isoform X2 n=1 Tax=Musca autumnalis TaxID=221902 RepID=UPI003CF6BE31
MVFCFFSSIFSVFLFYQLFLQVNVSNTWTMPQEGLNVFYRFFRDRISWFEADAVCQFHHANLVTVDNSFQFDATRDLLRELDVNDIVWIGLMRPQSSDRFMWSNSRPLVADTGYWAESLPLMDAPLCAVIDPIRDYRWHALRCGGPETASFLCEMPVPSWADVCILKDMPNLTMQYMADTASIELIRNCQEEGLLRTTCQGKQDRERALQDLICPRERLEAQRINDITNSHFKSLQIINSIPSDNNENNDIELLPMDVSYGPGVHYAGEEDLQTEKNTVQRLIEQFNVDELMQADEPANMETVSSFYKIPGLIPKPVKKSAKKVVEYPKKESVKKQTAASGQLQQKEKNSRMPLEMEDMMMGDQPQGEPEMPEQILNEEVSNEILEPLPHIKKTNIHKEAMEKMEKEAIAIKESMQRSKEMEKKKAAAVAFASTTEAVTAPTTTMVPTTTTMRPESISTIVSTSSEAFVSPSTTSNPVTTITTTKDAESGSTHHNYQETSTTGDVESSTLGHASASAFSTTPPATIGHPMHPQQPRSSVITEETQHGHVKESADNSHFIPPMLMVKSHYVPQANKHGHNEHPAHAPHAPGQHMDGNTHYNEDLAMPTTKSHSDMVMTTAKMIDFESSTTTLKSKDIERTTEHYHQNHEEVTQEQGEVEKKITTNSNGQIETKIPERVEETTENGNMIPITQTQLTKEEETETEQQIGEHNQNMKLEEEVVATTNHAKEEPTLTPLTTTAAPLESKATAETISTLNLHEDKTLQTTTMKLVEQTETPNTSDDIADKTEMPADVHRETQIADVTDAADTVTKAIVMKEIQTQTDMDEETTETEQTAKLVEETTAAVAATTTTMKTTTTTTSTPEEKHDLPSETATPITKTNPPAAAVARDDMLAKQEVAKPTPTTTHLATSSNLQESSTTTNLNKQKGDEDSTQKTLTSNAEQVSQTTTVGTATGSESDDTKKILTTDIQTTSGLIAAKDQHEQHKDTTIVTEATEGKESAITTTQNPTTETNETNTSNSNNNNNTPTTISTTQTTTTTTTPVETSSSSTTSSPVLSSSLPSSTDTTETFSTTTTTTITTSTSSPPTPTTTTSSPTETTRNFLKVTTEMPFKPNRRRSLTKPETVSYMKKILG